MKTNSVKLLLLLVTTLFFLLVLGIGELSAQSMPMKNQYHLASFCKGVYLVGINDDLPKSSSTIISLSLSPNTKYDLVLVGEGEISFSFNGNSITMNGNVQNISIATGDNASTLRLKIINSGIRKERFGYCLSFVE